VALAHCNRRALGSGTSTRLRSTIARDRASRATQSPAQRVLFAQSPICLRNPAALRGRTSKPWALCCAISAPPIPSTWATTPPAGARRGGGVRTQQAPWVVELWTH